MTDLIFTVIVYGIVLWCLGWCILDILRSFFDTD